MSTSAERMRRLRERQRAGLAPAEGAQLRDVDDLLAPAVAESVAALELGGRDQAAAAVALRLAQTIDAAQDQAYAMRHLGPLLLKALEALGATPASRPAAGKPARGAPNRVAQLRAAHMATKTRRRSG